MVRMFYGLGMLFVRMLHWSGRQGIKNFRCDMLGKRVCFHGVDRNFFSHFRRVDRSHIAERVNRGGYTVGRGSRFCLFFRLGFG